MALRLPADGHESGWVQLLPPPPPARPLAGAQRADFAVGYTGLAAARRLTELAPGARVVLLEAERVAPGPSGRNSGFVIDLPHNVDARDVEDVEANLRVRRLAQAGVAALRELVRRHAIDCDWSEIGKIHAAVAPSGGRARGAGPSA